MNLRARQWLQQTGVLVTVVLGLMRLGCDYDDSPYVEPPYDAASIRREGGATFGEPFDTDANAEVEIPPVGADDATTPDAGRDAGDAGRDSGRDAGRDAADARPN